MTLYYEEFIGIQDNRVAHITEISIFRYLKNTVLLPSVNMEGDRANLRHALNNQIIFHILSYAVCIMKL